MKVQKKINISLNGNDLPMPVRVVATDKAIQLVLRYIDFAIPDGTVATLFVKKPSGKFVYQTEDIAISGNTVTIDLYNQAIAERGKAYFTVTLENGEDTISTFENYFDVERNYKDSSAEESKTVMTGFKEMLEAYLLEHPIAGVGVTDAQLAIAIEEYFAKHPITGGAVSAEQIAQAVKDYFEENPVQGGSVNLTGYATENFVKEYAQPKGNYLTSSNLSDAVNTALAQAKASGEFNGKDGQDGYTPQKGTDYWTEADKAEIKSYVDEAILGGEW